MSLESCQENLKWKVFTLLGREACVLAVAENTRLATEERGVCSRLPRDLLPGPRVFHR